MKLADWIKTGSTELTFDALIVRKSLSVHLFGKNNVPLVMDFSFSECYTTNQQSAIKSR